MEIRSDCRNITYHKSIEDMIYQKAIGKRKLKKDHENGKGGCFRKLRLQMKHMHALHIVTDVFQKIH
jgi:hypothetical protein